MQDVNVRLDSHASEASRSDAVLEAARKRAVQERQYDSAAVRTTLATTFQQKFGQAPYSWQLDVTEAVLLGLDCTLIAGTGAGKTMPFIMPTFVNPDKIILIISPLDALEEDQATRFRRMGISAAVVNGTTWTEDLEKELRALKHTVILTSPEMCSKHPDFRDLLRDAKVKAHMGLVVIDEAHCISQWGGDFRPEYGDLSVFRSIFPPEVPILLTSATLPPAVLAAVRTSLEVNAATSYHLNLGNHRENIHHEVRFMRSATDYTALDFLVDSASKPEELEDTMVFVNSVQEAHSVRQYLVKKAGAWSEQYIGFLHSRRSTRSKKAVGAEFSDSLLRILVCTDVAGMGMDKPNVKYIVQFGAPASLTIWIQRAGRAGRARWLQSYAILLLEESVLQPARRTNTAGDDDGKELAFRKTIDSTLRQYVETTDCRQLICDDHFDCPPRYTCSRGALCCDNCARKAQPRAPTASSNADAPPSTPARRPTRRTGDRLQEVKRDLRDWRVEIASSRYRSTSLDALALLPDRILTTLAANRDIHTMDDMSTALATSWPFLKRHGSDVLYIIQKRDSYWDAKDNAARLAEEAEKLRTKEEKAARDAEARAVKEREKEEKRVRALQVREAKERMKEQAKEAKRLEKEAKKRQRELDAASKPARRTKRARQAVDENIAVAPAGTPAVASASDLGDTSLSTPVRPPRPRPRPRTSIPEDVAVHTPATPTAAAPTSAWIPPTPVSRPRPRPLRRPLADPSSNGPSTAPPWTAMFSSDHTGTAGVGDEVRGGPRAASQGESSSACAGAASATGDEARRGPPADGQGDNSVRGLSPRF